MRKEDYEQYTLHFPPWARLIDDGVKQVGILSGNDEQVALIRKCFPKRVVKNITKEQWDLMSPGQKNFDLLIAMNVFMYSSEPETWIKNVLARCKNLWIQDVVCGQRSNKGEVASGPDGDGDSMRYSSTPLLKARYEHAFDLSPYQERLRYLVAYRLDVPEHLPYGLSFIAFYRGDLDA